MTRAARRRGRRRRAAADEQQAQKPNQALTAFEPHPLVFLYQINNSSYST